MIHRFLIAKHIKIHAVTTTTSYIHQDSNSYNNLKIINEQYILTLLPINVKNVPTRYFIETRTKVVHKTVSQGFYMGKI